MTAKRDETEWMCAKCGFSHASEDYMIEHIFHEHHKSNITTGKDYFRKSEVSR